MIDNFSNLELTNRVADGIARLSKAKDMYSLTNEEITLPKSFWNECLNVRKATAYRATLEKLKLPIYDNELIVGDVPYYEFKANRELITSYLPSDEKDKLMQEAHNDYFRLKGEYPIDFEAYRNEFHTCVNYGHIIADYGLLLNTGFNGMIGIVENELSQTDDTEKKDFLSSVKIALNGAVTYIKRYSDEAGRLAAREENTARKAELEVIAKNCEIISEQSAGSFYQAVQLLWFLQLLLEIESGISAFSFGRADKYLYPFLKNDLENGIITMKDAQEIMDCFFIKANEQNNLTNDAGRAITIGGCDKDGKDLVNDVTYLMLNSAIRMRVLQPKINARFHKGSPQKYAELCAEGAAINAGIQMYNDEVIINSLVKYGYKFEDAVDYGMIGCYEYGMAGIDRPSPMSVTFHIGKCFEHALFDSTYGTYEELEAALQNQIAFYAGIMADKMLYDETVCQKIRPLPFLSAFVGDCIKNAADISCCGARYTTAGVRFTGFSAVADSLTAMNTLVYDKKLIDKDELLFALKNNFADMESMRQMLVNKAPKYGNDDDTADITAVRLGRMCCEEILRLSHISGAPLRPGLFSFSNFLNAGQNCGAFPNGRKAGEPFVNGVSPMHGADREGPTAMLASAAKLDYSISPNGATLDLKLQSNIYNKREEYKHLSEMVRAYFNMGGAHVQAYSLSVEELEAAKRDAEKYASLIIRVTGYSAYFVTLDDAMKDEIIKRTASL